ISSLLPCPHAHPALPSFPTRRSSDLFAGLFDPVLGECPLHPIDERPLDPQPAVAIVRLVLCVSGPLVVNAVAADIADAAVDDGRSEEHMSELQSLRHLVCRLLLEKKK